MQQGQVFELKKRAVDGSAVGAYRYRTNGPGSRRLQRGGFSSERDAAEALERALEHLRRQKGVGSTLTLKQLVEEYLAQHDVEPETIDKLRWLLAKALDAFGGRRLPELRSQEIAAWRMTISPGHRFEATQALRQVLARAVVWGMIDSNPAKKGVDNPQRRRTEKRPFESWAQLDELAVWLGPRYGPPVLFAAATGLRPGEWMALERRDIDWQARVEQWGLFPAHSCCRRTHLPPAYRSSRFLLRRTIRLPGHGLRLGTRVPFRHSGRNCPPGDGDRTACVDDPGRSACITAGVGFVAHGLPGEHATNPVGRAPRRVHGREGSGRAHADVH
jgi:integrase